MVVVLNFLCKLRRHDCTNHYCIQYPGLRRPYSFQSLRENPASDIGLTEVNYG